MAATFSLSFTLDSHKPHNHLYSNTHFKSNPYTLFQNPNPKSPFLIFPKSPRSSVILSSTSQSSTSTSDSSSSSSFSSTSTSDSLSSSSSYSTSTSESSSSSILLDPLRTDRFLTNEELEKLKLLEDFKYFQELKSGSMLIRVMRDDEMDMIVGLLAESFGESMLMPVGYLTILGMLVKQYLIERRALIPHTATLIAYYKDDDDDKEDDVQLAGTVEVSFDQIGANDSPPTPHPQKDSPYICNMTVKKTLRRKRIGWHLLKASEKLIYKMNLCREVYLHCRMIDEAPFNMYTKAGYDVIKTDNFFVFFTLQRRKHLMRKLLPSSQTMDDGSFSNDENPS